jgi:hypothetical protein
MRASCSVLRFGRYTPSQEGPHPFNITRPLP